MSFAWFDYYGRVLGIQRGELNCIPFGELLDLIACYQIAHGAKEKRTPDDEEMIPDLL